MLVAVRYSATADADGCVLTDAELGATVRVDPWHGNNITSFRVQHGRDPLDVLTARGAPILFPFVNRIPEGRSSIERQVFPAIVDGGFEKSTDVDGSDPPLWLNRVLGFGGSSSRISRRISS